MEEKVNTILQKMLLFPHKVGISGFFFIHTSKPNKTYFYIYMNKTTKIISAAGIQEVKNPQCQSKKESLEFSIFFFSLHVYYPLLETAISSYYLARKGP